MIKDILGVELKVGDTIAYPGRRRSSMWMNIGTIHCFGKDWNNRFTITVKISKTKKSVTLYRLDRVVKAANGITPAISRSIAFTRHSFPKGEMTYPLAAIPVKRLKELHAQKDWKLGE